MKRTPSTCAPKLLSTAAVLVALLCLIAPNAKAQTLTPASLSFGNWPVQTTSGKFNITLNNTQTVALTINSISPSGNFAEASTTCPLSPNTLAAGATCTISLTFTPLVLGAQSGTLTVNDNAGNSPQTAQLSGTGVAPVAALPASLAFGNQAVNTTSAAKNVTLWNYQTTPLTISGISTSGDFAQTSNCPLSPSTLAARANCTISVTFTPLATGALSGTLTVTDNASNSPQTAGLSGTGTTPVSLTQSALGFGNQYVNTTSAVKTDTLQNEQTVPLTITNISTSSNFAQTSNCPVSPSTLAAGSTCTISVTFTPTVSGNQTGTLTVTDSASNSPQTASLTGTGLLPVTLSATSITFPSEIITQSSPAKNINARNTWTSAVTISAISVSGDFAQTSNCPLSPNTLAVGASCSTSVTFTPTLVGTRTGTLTITDNTSTSPQTAALSGTGTLTGLFSIAVTPAAPSIPLGQQQQFAAQGAWQSGLSLTITPDVTWSSSASGVASVNAAGVVQAVTQGTATITATYGSVSGSTTVTVGPPIPTSITVIPGNPGVATGAYQQFTATLNYSNGSTKDTTSTVTWSSGTPSVASISSSGLATALTAGSTSITATLGSVNGSTTLSVSTPQCVNPPPGLTNWWTGDGNTVDIAGSNSGTLQSGATYGNGEVGQAFSFGGNGASLSINAPVYSPTAGTLMFWFQATGAGPEALTGGFAGGQNRAPGLSLDSADNLKWEFANLHAQPVGQVNPNQWNHAALTYSTSNGETSVNVYLNGVLVADAVTDANTSWNSQVAFGAYMGAQLPSFTGSLDEIAVFNQALSASQIQQVYNAFSGGMCKPTLQSITVNPPTPSVPVGFSLQFDALGSYSNSTTHDVTTSSTWSSTNTGAATVSAVGLATGVASGNSTISATLGSVQGSTNLTVGPSLSSIQVTPQNISLDVGAVQALTATGTFSDGTQQNLTSSVSWSTSARTVASVSSSGQITGVGAGPATITATSGSVSGSTQVTVNSATLSSITVSPANPAAIAIGITQQFTATGTFSDGTQQNLTATVSWSSSASGVATIATTGLASAVGAGQATITATMGLVSGTASLSVTSAVLTAVEISPLSPSLIIGGNQQFSATAIYSNGTSGTVTASATWSSSVSTVATMSTTTPGLAASTGTGETTISATLGGLTGSTTLAVQDELVSIAITPTTFSIFPGNTQQFAATGTYASGITQNLTNSVSWSSSALGVATISSSGLATTVAAGQTNIGASLGTIAASVTMTVLSPTIYGQWSTLSATMPINPIHVTMSPGGNLLVVAGSGACPARKTGCPSGPPFGPANGSGALVITPGSWQITQYSVVWDMFCNGMITLMDGTALIAGGTIQYDPFHGSSQAAIFDPSADTFTDVNNMAHGRWYPTLLTLNDGSVMVFGGLDENGNTNNTVEFYTIGSGWSVPYTAPWVPDFYPRMHVLPSGNVFYSGGQTESNLFNPTTQTWTLDVATTNYGGERLYGTSILLPLTPANNYDPKIIVMGGGNPATNTTEIIDMGATTPAWQYGPNMSQARIQMNGVILPNGQVLALGGSLNNEDLSTASLNADLYNPVTNTFSSAGATAYPRLYHSVALLLPDATVWVAGSNPLPDDFEPHMEIYQPSYLFNSDGSLATRPSITNAPSSITWGSQFTVTTPDAANISSVVLMRTPSVTHAFGFDQRDVALSYTVGSGSLTVTAPPNGNIAPPGYYYLFILNNSGVPSLAAFVQVTTGS